MPEADNFRVSLWYFYSQTISCLWYSKIPVKACNFHQVIRTVNKAYTCCLESNIQHVLKFGQNFPFDLTSGQYARIIWKRVLASHTFSAWNHKNTLPKATMLHHDISWRCMWITCPLMSRLLALSVHQYAWNITFMSRMPLSSYLANMINLFYLDINQVRNMQYIKLILKQFSGCRVNIFQGILAEDIFCHWVTPDGRALKWLVRQAWTAFASIAVTGEHHVGIRWSPWGPDEFSRIPTRYGACATKQKWPLNRSVAIGEQCI